MEQKHPWFFSRQNPFFPSRCNLAWWRLRVCAFTLLERVPFVVLRACEFKTPHGDRVCIRPLLFFALVEVNGTGFRFTRLGGSPSPDWRGLQTPENKPDNPTTRGQNSSRRSTGP